MIDVIACSSWQNQNYCAVSTPFSMFSIKFLIQSMSEEIFINAKYMNKTK